MIINADHANHMLALTLVIDDQYVIIECMDSKKWPSPNGACSNT